MSREFTSDWLRHYQMKTAKQHNAELIGEAGPISDPLGPLKSQLDYVPAKRVRQSSKPLMNKTELRWAAELKARQIGYVLEQAITLRLDPPFKSYRPDIAVVCAGEVRFWEVKAPHRFAQKGIAKAALAAKTYPQFEFTLAMWDGKRWEETKL